MLPVYCLPSTIPYKEHNHDQTTRAGSHYVDELSVGGWHLDADGMLAIPDTPGLGVTLDMDAVAKYTGGEVWL